MALFSERYGYTKPSEVLIRGKITTEIENVICSCYDVLYDALRKNYTYSDEIYNDMELYLWTQFLNNRRNDFYGNYGGHMVVATSVIKSDDYEWFIKINMLEMSVQWLHEIGEKKQWIIGIVKNFVAQLNHEFARLSFAYRIVGKEVVEITSQNEIAEIEEALLQTSNIKSHLSEALKLLSNRPNPDYRNSIKESISAVEALCREITGENTLGPALKALDKKGLAIPTFLKSGFEKLYYYTNNSKTGIRHALMDASDAPSFEEAKFMLVACSAFVNYIQGKRTV